MKSSILKTHENCERGIYFIDPEDKEFKETIKNARKKLETSIAPAMPCKIMKKKMPHAMKIPTVEAAVDQESEKL